jgi:AcrR family transcriptional regulator
VPHTTGASEFGVIPAEHAVLAAPVASRPAKRGAYAKTAARRREILEAGMEVFATNGFRNGSIREVAERVGISQAGLLHHFASKNLLLAGVLELRDEHSAELARLDEERGLKTIQAMVRTVQYNTTMPRLVELHCVLSAEATASNHPAHSYFVNRYSWVVGFLTEAFTAMAAEGQLIAGADPAGAARGLVAQMDGLEVQWLLDPDSIDMVEETSRFLRRLMTVDL